MMSHLALVLASIAFMAAPQASEGFGISTNFGSLCQKTDITWRSVGRASTLGSLCMMAEEGSDEAPAASAAAPLNRKARRDAEKATKKGTTGATKSLVQGTGGVRAGKDGKQPVKSKLVEVASVEDVGPEEGARKSVEIEDTNPKRIVMLLRHKGNIMGVNPGCTKCKFPLVGAEVEKSTIRCKLCGSTWKLPGGEMAESSEGTMMSGLFSSTKQTPLPIFATKIMAGKVYMGIAL